MTNTHSTRDLRKVATDTRGELNDTLLTVQRQLSNKIDENTSRIVNELNNLRKTMLSIEARIMPRIFALMPAEKESDFIKYVACNRRLLLVSRKSFKALKNLGRQEFTVIFFCEGDITHRAPHEGYKLVKPNEFLRKYGQWIALGLKLLKFALQASPLPDIIPADLPDLLIVSKDVVANKIVEYTNAVLDDAIKSTNLSMQETDGAKAVRDVNLSTMIVLDEGMQRAFLGIIFCFIADEFFSGLYR